MRRRQRASDVPAWSGFGIAIELGSGMTFAEMLPGGRQQHEKPLSNDDTLRAAWAKYRERFERPEQTYAYARFEMGLDHGPAVDHSEQARDAAT